MYQLISSCDVFLKHKIKFKLKYSELNLAKFNIDNYHTYGIVLRTIVFIGIDFNLFWLK